MRYVRFNFIDETFGEEVECLLIWDDEEFIIVTLDEEEIKIKKYKDMQELQEMAKKGAILLDVRSPQEYEEGHINGAILIPEYELKRDAEKILTNKEEIIIAYCSTGTRSKKAQKELKEKGYKYVYNLYNGLEM